MSEDTASIQPARVQAKIPIIAEYTKIGFEYLGFDPETGIHHFQLIEGGKKTGVPGIYTLKGEKFFFAGYRLEKRVLRRLKK